MIKQQKARLELNIFLKEWKKWLDLLIMPNHGLVLQIRWFFFPAIFNFSHTLEAYQRCTGSAWWAMPVPFSGAEIVSDACVLVTCLGLKWSQLVFSPVLDWQRLLGFKHIPLLRRMWLASKNCLAIISRKSVTGGFRAQPRFQSSVASAPPLAVRVVRCGRAVTNCGTSNSNTA